MRKTILFPCLLLLIGAWHNVQAAVVSVTMNSVTKTLTLQNESGDPVAHDALNVNAGKNTYVFNNLTAGDYTIYGYNSSNVLNGTMTFTVGDEDIEMQIWTITKISTSNKKENNSYWVYGGISPLRIARYTAARVRLSP